LLKIGTNVKIILKSKDLKIKNIKDIAPTKTLSPILFKTIAFKAAFNPVILEFQKLINKKEHKPIPSHPINKTIKLEALTNISIKKVKSDNNEINFNKFES